MLRYLCALALALPAASLAGSFYLAEEPGFADRIAHTPGYAGQGGEYAVEVCMEPGSPNLAETGPLLQRAITTWNALHASTGNFKAGDNSPVPSGTFDWETVLLHELGHCVHALAHANGTPGNPNARYVVSLPGADNTESLAPGADGTPGTEDDLRGDDLPYTWFPLASNNPFEVLSNPSPQTMGIVRGQLPAGHLFPRAALRGTARRLGLPPTESVMASNFFPRESKRSLTADEVNTVRLALAGLDEMHGTADDYRVRLVYGGEKADCELMLRWRTAAGSAPVLAWCAQPAFTPLNGRHIGMGFGRSITFYTNHPWSFALEGAQETGKAGGTLEGLVWNDLDRDGSRDLTELGIPHVAVVAKNSLGKIIASAKTGSDGRYLLAVTRDGSYRLSVTRPADFEAFSPADIGSDSGDSDVDAGGEAGSFTLAGGTQRQLDAGLLLRPTPGRARDRLRCHRTSSEQMAAAPIAISDGYGQFNFTPRKLVAFCDAVDTEGVQTIIDPRSALACYAGPREGEKPAGRSVRALTAFGESAITLGAFRYECFPADHKDRGFAPLSARLQCYRAKGASTAVGHTLTDEYDRRAVESYAPALACFASIPGEGYLCHNTKKAKRQNRYRSQLANYRSELEDNATLTKPGVVCLPAVFE